MPKYDSCHDRCKELFAHSICIVGTPLKTPILAQMIAKVEAIDDVTAPQQLVRLGRYMGVERLYKKR